MTQREYEQYVFTNIFVLSNKFQFAGNSMLKDISIKQWFLLLIISKKESESPSLTEIAEAFGSSRQNVTKMIEALEKKGYVQTKQHETDRRNISVSTTPKTRDFFSEFEARENEFLDAAFNDISDVRLKIVASVFAKLHENLDALTKKETD